MNDIRISEEDSGVHMQLLHDPKADPLQEPLQDSGYVVVSVYPGVVYPDNPSPEVVCQNWFLYGTLFTPPTSEESIDFLAIPGLAGTPGGLARMINAWNRAPIEGVELHGDPFGGNSLHEALVACRPAFLLTYLERAGFEGESVRKLQEDAMEEEREIQDARRQLLAGDFMYLG